jgi:hypothetical protein
VRTTYFASYIAFVSVRTIKRHHHHLSFRVPPHQLLGTSRQSYWIPSQIQPKDIYAQLPEGSLAIDTTSCSLIETHHYNVARVRATRVKISDKI